MGNFFMFGQAPARNSARVASYAECQEVYAGGTCYLVSGVLAQQSGNLMVCTHHTHKHQFFCHEEGVHKSWVFSIPIPAVM